ncbi:hypothetical protein SESBI_49907 [Sesbania bispinosa]|nr:hypothetical protein SESBI_49907 [Sesbania bispinosa]
MTRYCDCKEPTTDFLAVIYRKRKDEEKWRRMSSNCGYKEREDSPCAFDESEARGIPCWNSV